MFKFQKLTTKLQLSRLCGIGIRIDRQINGIALEFRNKPLRLWLADFNMSAKNNSIKWGKIVFSTNALGTIDYPSTCKRVR